MSVQVGVHRAGRTPRPRTPTRAPSPPAGGCPAPAREGNGGGAAGAAPLLTRNAARDKDAAFPPPTKGDALPRPSRRRGALTAPRSPLPSSPPLLPARRGLAEALPPAALPAVPPYPLAARRGAEPEPPQAAAPGRRPPCHSLGGRGGAQPGRRELGGRPGLAEEDAGGGGGGGGWGRQRGPLPPPGRRRRLRVLRGHGRALRPARTKGAARGRPAPKSSWLADPAAAGSRVGGWKGSADAPPGCPQPLALVPSKKKKKEIIVKFTFCSAEMRPPFLAAPGLVSGKEELSNHT